MNKKIFLGCAVISWCASAQVLPAGGALTPGQSITSPAGRYTLTMEEDGRLVYYRNSDKSVKWVANIGGPGSRLVMHDDGDLIASTSSGPVWRAGTHRPGAHLVAQDDGDLVVRTDANIYWHLGAEADGEDPLKSGDVVGRDLDIIGLGALGHIAMYDGWGSVYEVLNLGGNAARKNSLASFKAASPYWGAVDPNPPDFTVTRCFSTNCQGGNPPKETVAVRVGMVKRAYQVMQIGVEYSLDASYRSALPPEIGLPVQKGKYRCDTFVVDVLRSNSPNVTPGNSVAITIWLNKMANLLAIPILPRAVFERLKNQA